MKASSYIVLVTVTEKTMIFDGLVSMLHTEQDCFLGSTGEYTVQCQQWLEYDSIQDLTILPEQKKMWEKYCAG